MSDTADTVLGARESIRVESFIQHLSFAGVFLLTLCSVVGCYFVLVTIVNPRREFRPRVFPEIIPNSRGLKLELLQQYNAAGKVDLILLGSSRSMKISPDVLEALTNERAFNASVFSGGANDFLSMYRVMKRRGIIPKTLVIALDQNVLDPASQPAPDFVSNLALQSALKGSDPSLPERIGHQFWLYKHTLTPSYLMDTARSLWIWLRPRPPLNRFQADGHLDYIAWDMQIRANAYPRAEQIRKCIDSQVGEFNEFHDVSPAQKANLEHLLSEAQADGARVVLWITPMHPAALERIQQSPEARMNFLRAEAQLLQLAAGFHLPVYDLTESKSFGAESDSWYDCIHYNDADATRISKALFKNGLQF